jgi:uncharacterized protein (DUF305 family)
LKPQPPTGQFSVAVDNHEGAVAIVEAEVAGDSYPDAVELAKEMVAAHKAETVAMRELPTRL